MFLLEIHAEKHWKHTENINTNLNFKTSANVLLQKICIFNLTNTGGGGKIPTAPPPSPVYFTL